MLRCSSNCFCRRITPVFVHCWIVLSIARWKSGIAGGGFWVGSFKLGLSVVESFLFLLADLQGWQCFPSLRHVAP